ncbi:hypothetical protein DIPPA_05234 [Diplonema papillatum]|nr:hypothetical protein DIPPA_05234 [Diplonema papillatum]
MPSPSQLSASASGDEAQREPCGEPLHWKLVAHPKTATAATDWKRSVSRSYKGEWAGGYEVDFSVFLDDLGRDDDQEPVRTGIQHKAASWKESCREGPDACSISSWETDDASFASDASDADEKDSKKDVLMWASVEDVDMVSVASDADCGEVTPVDSRDVARRSPGGVSPLTVPAADPARPSSPANQAKPAAKPQTPARVPQTSSPSPATSKPAGGPSLENPGTPEPHARVAASLEAPAPTPDPATSSDVCQGRSGASPQGSSQAGIVEAAVHAPPAVASGGPAPEVSLTNDTPAPPALASVPAANRLVVTAPTSPAAVDDEARDSSIMVPAHVPDSSAAGHESRQPASTVPPPGHQAAQPTAAEPVQPNSGSAPDSVISNDDSVPAAAAAAAGATNPTPGSSTGVATRTSALSGQASFDSPNDDCFTTSDEADSKDSSPPRCAQPAGQTPKSKRKAEPPPAGSGSKRRACLNPEDIT